MITIKVKIDMKDSHVEAFDGMIRMAQQLNCRVRSEVYGMSITVGPRATTGMVMKIFEKRYGTDLSKAISVG